MRILFIALSFFTLSSIAQNNELQIPESPFNTYKVNIECNVIEHSSGTKIIVPKNAFDCQGEVVLKYKEFRDPYDMIIHNIPMHIDVDGKLRQLESGGMFEIRAECDGKPNQLNPGKEIQIRYKCDKHLDNLEVYKMNEQTNTWSNNNKTIMEMSFDPNNNSSTRPDLWGNTSIVSEEQMMADEMETGESFGQHPYFEGIFKGVNISEMGIYNYDALINEEGVIPIEASVEIKGMADLDFQMMYVVYDSLNTTYSYSEYNLKNQFVIKPNFSANIFVILRNGFIATFPLSKFLSIDWEEYRNKKYKFQMEYNPVKPTKKADLK